MSAVKRRPTMETKTDLQIALDSYVKLGGSLDDLTVTENDGNKHDGFTPFFDFSQGFTYI